MQITDEVGLQRQQFCRIYILETVFFSLEISSIKLSAGNNWFTL